MLPCIDKIVQSYRSHGFTVATIMMDKTFRCLEEDFQERNIHANFVSADEYESVVERCIRHVKERYWCTFTALKFKQLGKRLTVKLVNVMVYYINCVPRHDEVHRILSPQMIMTGQQLIVKNTVFQFGDFVQAKQPSRSKNTGNSMEEQTCDAIYCFPSRNIQWGYWVYTIKTNQVVHRNTATLAHSSDLIQQQIKQIAANKDALDGLSFADREGSITIILDFDKDEAEHDNDVSDDEFLTTHLDESEDEQSLQGPGANDQADDVLSSDDNDNESDSKCDEGDDAYEEEDNDDDDDDDDDDNDNDDDGGNDDYDADNTKDNDKESEDISDLAAPTNRNLDQDDDDGPWSPVTKR